jgi:hypothetical protein
VVGIGGGSLGLVGCGGSGPPICPPFQRHVLLQAHLTDYGGNLQSFSEPSAPFTLAPGTSAFVSVTGRNSLGRSAEQLHVLNGSAPPRLAVDATGGPRSDDPLVTVGSLDTWHRLPVGPGPHRLYAYSDPTVEVVSCPA